MIRLLLFALVAWPAASRSLAADGGRVVAVTVFQGQALVTREVDLPADGGLAEVVVTGLPERLLPGSLYAEGGDGVDIRSVRTRLRPAESAPREEVQELEEALADINRELAVLLGQRRLLGERAQYLSQLEQFTAGQGRNDLQKGVLDAGALREMTDLIFSEREELVAREHEVEIEQQRLSKERDLKQRELQTLTGGSDRTAREAVVFVDKRPGAATARLRYLVAGATWSPSYNVRAADADGAVTLEYNASVTQMSGEDWEGVAMTLSTATPSLVATAPKLDPLKVRLVANQQPPARQSKLDLSRMQQTLAANRGVAIANGPSGVGGRIAEEAADAPASEDLFFGGFGAVYDDASEGVELADRRLNSYAGKMQVLDLTTTVGRAVEKPAPETEGMSVVYRLPKKTSLPSRSDKQLIRIASIAMEAVRYRVASPVLTSYVYREARLTNASEHVLLAGPAATFLGDRFVGRGDVPTVAAGESFTVGLGIDESLRASRELIDKSDRVQGGNRVARFDYELRVENFGDTAAEVRVVDRLPKSEGEAIRATLAESSPEPLAGHEGADEGLLRWDVSAPAGESATIAYTLQVEHDKNLTLVGVEK